MLSFAPNIRIFLHARPTDMRNSFDGLCGLVRSVLQADPLDGSLFLFVNRRGDRIKTLWWDRDGPDEFLVAGNFQGTMIGDCYSDFQQITLRSDARIIRAACNAHAEKDRRGPDERSVVGQPLPGNVPGVVRHRGPWQDAVVCRS